MNEARTDTLRLADDMQEPQSQALAGGRVAAFSTSCIGKQNPNEDSAALLPVDAQRAVIIVADGFGGQPVGEQASRLAVDAMIESVRATTVSGGDLQAGILAGFDVANKAVLGLGVGAATTLAAVEIDDGRIRAYHVGDSEVMVVGQRGRLKLRTIPHSPVGYGVHAGMLDQDEALLHNDRHVVSNMVGTPDMRIDLGPLIELRPRDTLVAATDGLFDNLTLEEIVHTVRKGDLLQSTGRLVARCRERMSGTTEGPCKPDDLTVIVFRPN